MSGRICILAVATLVLFGTVNLHSQSASESFGADQALLQKIADIIYDEFSIFVEYSNDDFFSPKNVAIDATTYKGKKVLGFDDAIPVKRRAYDKISLGDTMRIGLPISTSNNKDTLKRFFASNDGIGLRAQDFIESVTLTWYNTRLPRIKPLEEVLTLTSDGFMTSNFDTIPEDETEIVPGITSVVVTVKFLTPSVFTSIGKVNLKRSKSFVLFFSNAGNASISLLKPIVFYHLLDFPQGTQTKRTAVLLTQSTVTPAIQVIGLDLTLAKPTRLDTYTLGVGLIAFPIYSDANLGLDSSLGVGASINVEDILVLGFGFDLINGINKNENTVWSVMVGAQLEGALRLLTPK